MNFARDDSEFGRIPPRHAHSYQADSRLRWVEHLARLMDSQFQIPGTNFKFGLDPLMNLVPVIGGIPSVLVSALLISTMMRHGASGEVAVRMVANVAIDAILGAVPILGTIFDFTFRANDRNVRLLREHYNEGRYQGSGRGLVTVLLLGLIALCGAIAWGVWMLLAGLWHLIS
ncbi:MAG: DUF4112 domain-containing protein [Planctomycetia bacterium]|nr:DUF4112 domain-containing protein [Planctomycetia bacterium]